MSYTYINSPFTSGSLNIYDPTFVFSFFPPDRFLVITWEWLVTSDASYLWEEPYLFVLYHPPTPPQFCCQFHVFLRFKTPRNIFRLVTQFPIILLLFFWFWADKSRTPKWIILKFYQCLEISLQGTQLFSTLSAGFDFYGGLGYDPPTPQCFSMLCFLCVLIIFGIRVRHRGGGFFRFS